MPALPAVPGVAKVVLRQVEGLDVDCINGLFRTYTGSGPTTTECTNYAALIAAAWATDLAPMASGAIELKEVTVTDLGSSSGATGTWTGSHLGTRSGVDLSAGACAIVSHKIARRYRGGHPRSYFPFGVAGDLQDRQEWSTSFQAALLAAWFNFLTAIGSTSSGSFASNGGVNVSYYHGFTNFLMPSGRYRVIPTLRSSPLVDNFINHSVNPKVGSQRRRDLQSS